jgi:N-methylhydantoinase A
VFSACGAGNMHQMHIHEASVFMVLFDSNRKQVFGDYARFNDIVADLERRGSEDLTRQGMRRQDIRYRLELDMRYGNQRVETAVVTDLNRLASLGDVLKLIDQFHTSYGNRFGEGSQAPEAGVRINTIRVCSYVELETVRFTAIKPTGPDKAPPAPVGSRPCHYIGHEQPLATPIYDDGALEEGVRIAGPAIVITAATTYLVEPGWQYRAAGQGAVWFSEIK